jgi:DNA-binding MarR family transcriptional regulator
MGSLKKPGSLLCLVSKAHHHLSSQIFNQMGLYRGQPPVLFELGSHEGIPQAELSDILEVTAATMTNMLRRMEAAGLVRRVRDAADARVSRVYLTEAGKSALAAANQLTERIDEIAFAGLTSGELVTLTNLLDRVHTNLTAEKASSSS